MKLFIISLIAISIGLIDCQIDNCEIIKQVSNFCTLCEYGMTPSTTGQKCLKCPANCLENQCVEDTTNGNTTICKQCKPFYYLNSNLCKECPKNCLKCQNSTCIQCFPNMGFNQNSKQCQPCPNNCEECSWNDIAASLKCSKCKPFHYMNIDRNCHACSANCRQCTVSSDNRGVCTTCLNGYYRDESFNCKACDSTNPGCIKCINGEACLRCGEKYTFSSSGKCKLCSGATQNCLKCAEKDSTTLTCTECLPGYGINSDKCSECPGNCLKCLFKDGKSVCTSCKDRYSLVAGLTCQRCKNSKCRQCSEDGDKEDCKLNQCMDGYTNDLSLPHHPCIECPKDCRRCNYNLNLKKSFCISTKTENYCGRKDDGGIGWTVNIHGNCLS